MLYKVTPLMAPAAPEKAKPREPGQPRKKRKSAVYDADGHEVLISLMCLKCRTLKPLAQFGLRKMADGAIRNQPWCRTCRSGAGTKKPKGKAAETSAELATEAPASAAEESTVALQAMAAEAELPESAIAEAAMADAQLSEAEEEEEPAAEPAPAPSEG